MGPANATLVRNRDEFNAPLNRLCHIHHRHHRLLPSSRFFFAAVVFCLLQDADRFGNQVKTKHSPSFCFVLFFPTEATVTLNPVGRKKSEWPRSFVAPCGCLPMSLDKWPTTRPGPRLAPIKVQPLSGIGAPPPPRLLPIPAPQGQGPSHPPLERMVYLILAEWFFLCELETPDARGVEHLSREVAKKNELCFY